MTSWSLYRRMQKPSFQEVGIFMPKFASGGTGSNLCHQNPEAFNFMAWIRSEQSLQRHPKTLLLSSLMKVDLETTIGRLHMLWWWCLDYALDGNLAKHMPEVLESACNIPLELLKQVKFVDTHPYLRIHDWWSNQGSYLKLRFKDRPDKWREIETLYERRSKLRSKHRSPPNRNPVDVRTYKTEQKKTDVQDVQGQSTDFSSLSSQANGGKKHVTNCSCERCFSQKVLGK